MLESKPAEIWFGPGGLQGVFGSGVAYGIQLAIQRGELDPRALRLYGSSVGCLIASYLATSNTQWGLSIFLEDGDQVVSKRNVVPMLAACTVNRLGRFAGRGSAMLTSPAVLRVDAVIQLMLRRTPDVFEQLRTANMQVFAESVDGETGEFCHTDLRAVDDPLRWVRASMNLAPFTHDSRESHFDSNVKGYGFTQLLAREECPSLRSRRLVVVLNAVPRHRILNSICSRICAGLCMDRTVAKLYVTRDRNFRMAIRTAECHRDVLVIRRPGRQKHVETAHHQGMMASREVVEFLRSGDGDDWPAETPGDSLEVAFANHDG